MTQRFTYDFTNQDGNTSDIVVVAASAATTDSTDGSGYDLLSVAGTFDGKIIAGMEGASGSNQNDDNIGPWDNVIFTDNTQGAGGSTDGIDAAGIAFTTTDGQAYSLYSLGGEFDDQTLTISGNALTLNSYDPISNDSPPCYCEGSRIRTWRGEIAVENLETSDLVITNSGEAKPVVWIGHRWIDVASHARADLVRPVRIAACALGKDLPIRDLLVSPEHALWLENALVPARSLINGATIKQEPCDSIRYYHVELEKHDILLAEGVPAESYLNCDNRINFDNANDGDMTLQSDWRAVAAARPFANPALTARLRDDFAARAYVLGRGREVCAYEAAQRIRGSVTRTNFVRNPRAEGSIPGWLGAGGKAPTHWLLFAPEGIDVLILESGYECGLPFLDVRYTGCATTTGACCIYPEAKFAAAAQFGQDWTLSCYLRKTGGDFSGIQSIDMYIDECDATGAYLTGQNYPQSYPNADDLAHQRVSVTRRMRSVDVEAVRGYIRLIASQYMVTDITLRIGGMQIEEGVYASDVILPPVGAQRSATRIAVAESYLCLT